MNFARAASCFALGFLPPRFPDFLRAEDFPLRAPDVRLSDGEELARRERARLLRRFLAVVLDRRREDFERFRDVDPRVRLPFGFDGTPVLSPCTVTPAAALPKGPIAASVP